MSFRAGTPKGSTVRYKFLQELGKASGLSVAEARRGMNGIRDTLLKNLKANKYSRIPEMLLFHGVMQRPTRPAVTVIYGKARVFAARTVLKRKVKGTVLKPLREAFS